MAREGSELTRFATVATPIAGVRSCVVWVPEEWLDDDTDTSEGILLKNFMPRKVDLGRALRRKYGNHALTQAGEQADGLQAFWFAKVRTPEQIAVPYRTLRKDRMGIPWPPVLFDVAAANIVRYDDDGSPFVAGTVWDFDYSKKFYDGLTKVEEEWYMSHTSFNVPAPQVMQPMGGTLPYDGGSVTVPECLHGAFTLTYTVEESPRAPAATYEKIFAATTPTTRPATMVLEQEEVFQNGVYILRIVKAYEP